MNALYFNEFGSAEVLCYGEVSDPELTQGELLLKMDYIGLNFADIYRRRGTYHLENHTPYIDGYEGVGEVVGIGAGVEGYQLGEKIFFVDAPFANAELVAIPQEKAMKIPADLGEKLVATIGLQGLTADFLAHDLGKNVPQEKVFIHGVSGGVGQILSQMLTADGIFVYGVTSTEEKRTVALKQGAREIFLRNSDWLNLNAGAYDTVYDGVGITIEQSLTLLKHRGKVVFFGMAGGNPPQIDLVSLLAQSKSILTGDLWDYLTDHKERLKRSQRLFDYFLQGKIKVSEPTIFPLKEGQKAHEYLESGKNIGKILLVP